MATTKNYGLFVSNPSDSKVFNWRMAIAGETDSNMTIIDETLHKLSQNSNGLSTESFTLGNGIDSVFILEHGLDSENLLVNGYKTVNDKSQNIVIEYNIIDNNKIEIDFEDIIDIGSITVDVSTIS